MIAFFVNLLKIGEGEFMWRELSKLKEEDQIKTFTGDVDLLRVGIEGRRFLVRIEGAGKPMGMWIDDVSGQV